jgi:hypothetical protein
LGNIKKLTIISAFIVMIGGLVFWGTSIPSPVGAQLPSAGLATPRVRSSALTNTLPLPRVSSIIQEAPIVQAVEAEVARAAIQPAVELSSSAVQSAAPLAGQPVQPIDPANEYIYKFLNSYRPLEASGGCAEIWEIVPDYVRLPNWLTTPDRPEQIYSKVSLYYLAGMLIRNKSVDASQCANGGISVDNQWIANTCGLTKAYTAVIEWQNRFNKVILDNAKQIGVPAQLVKTIFSRESQFWPGIFTTLEEAGFGQLTVGGADVLLMWNTNFYGQFCPQVLVPEACKKGYTNLSIKEQQMLTGALVRMVNASCPTCADGVDPQLADFSVRIFSENLVANCNQVGQIIQNETNRKPNRVSTYQDLWMFTLVNYHAGPGCLRDAIRATAKDHYDMTWDLVAANLPDYCASAKAYVEEIIYMPEVAPNPAPSK